jgi:cyclin C
MAANYWDSSQRKHWTFTKQELVDMRKAMESENQQLHAAYPLPDRRLLNIYFSFRKTTMTFPWMTAYMVGQENLES